MGTEPTQEPGSISVGDFEIQSGQASENDLKEQFKDEIEKDTKEAASKLGKKGAEAKKAKAEEEKPDQPKEGAVEEAQDEESTDEKKAQDAESEEQAEESEDKQEKKLGKPKHDPRARVQQAVAQKNQAERERDQALARLSQLEERLSRLEGGDKPEPKTEKKVSEKPDPSTFDDYESYLDARDEWNLQRWTEQYERESQQRAQMSEQDRALAQAVDRFRESVGQDISGWSDEVLQLKTEFQLGENETPSGENWIANELVFNPESAAPLGLYLSQHPDEFQAIAGLSTPRDVSRAMAKLEARLESATTGTRPEREEKSEPPPPVRPVRGGAHVGATDPGPKPGESFDDWWKRAKPGNPYR